MTLRKNSQDPYRDSVSYRENLLPFVKWITERHQQSGGVTEIRILQGNRAYVGWFDYEHQEELIEALLPMKWLDSAAGPGRHWYLLKVIQADQEMAWTSPIWVNHE